MEISKRLFSMARNLADCVLQENAQNTLENTLREPNPNLNSALKSFRQELEKNKKTGEMSNEQIYNIAQNIILSTAERGIRSH